MLDPIGDIRKDIRLTIYKDILSHQRPVQELNWNTFTQSLFHKYSFYVSGDIRVTVYCSILPSVYTKVYISTQMPYGWLKTELKLSWWKRWKIARHIINWCNVCNGNDKTKERKPQGHQPSHMEKMLCKHYNIEFE